MRVIKQYETLTVTGKNIYPDADTILYWNSIDDANRAAIIPDSFNSTNTQVQVTVPCCLPEYTKVVLCNTVGCYTGTQAYRYVGVPQIDDISPSRDYWARNITVKGKYFEDVTGVFAGDTEVTEYHWPSKRKIILKIPNGFDTGPISIRTKVDSVTSESLLTGVRPPMRGNLINSPKYYNETALIQGESLDIVDRVVLQGIGADINVDEDNLTHNQTTELSFKIPEGTLKDSSIKIQDTSGHFQNGEFNISVNEQASMPESLDIKSTHISSFDKTTEIYNEPITISGINLENSKILFLGYDNTYIEGPSTNNGALHKTVSVPKNIKFGNIIASGVGGEYTGVSVSENSFYPAPTIFHVPAQSWTAGDTVEIKAVNASEVIRAVGITGTNLMSGENSTFYISNPDTHDHGGPNYFGYTHIDNSELSVNPTDGITRITAVVNSVMAGEGKLFLISAHEIDGEVNVSALNNQLSDSYPYKNLSKIVYPTPVAVSGKKPVIIGVSHPRSATEGQVSVSGRYFLGATGVQLYNSSEVKTLPRSSFVDVYPNEKVGTVPSGSLITYERNHYILLNVEDFNFTSRQGQFKILAPYHE
jgi:hypothetical protein